MADSSLLNDYEPNITRNDPTPQPVDIHVFIVVDPSEPLDPPAHDDTMFIFIKTLQAYTVITFPIAVLTTK